MIKSKIIYLFLSAILIFGLNLYVSKNEMYVAKMSKIDNRYSGLIDKAHSVSAGNAITLVIGNSYVESSFIDTDTDSNAYKFTVAGMPLSDAVTIVETLPRNIDISTIVVGLGYNYAMPVLSGTSAYRRYDDISAVSKLWWSIPLVRGRSMISTALREDLKYYLKVIHGEASSRGEAVKNVDEGYLTSDEYQEKHYSWMLESTRKRHSEYIPFTGQVSDLFGEYLSRLNEAASLREAKLVLYTAPIYPELRSKIKPETINAFHTVIDEQKLTYVDLNDHFSGLDSSYFSDATHLDKEKGRPLTTNFLKDLLQNLPPEE